MEVLVEKWYTQEEYIAAKAAGAFAWQQPAPPAPTPPVPEPSPTRARRPFVSKFGPMISFLLTGELGMLGSLLRKFLGSAARDC